MNVLIACEESQTVCFAFRKKGHNAFSCDIQKCSGGYPEWHIKGDVLNILNGRCNFTTENGEIHEIQGKWDLIIAHPPCTYMSKAGARWMYPQAGKIDNNRYSLSLAAKEFFMLILNADCEKIAIENPVPLKIVGLPVPSQIIQPYEYGHPFSKKTCLWLKGLRPLKPTNVLENYTPFLPSNTSCFSKGKGGSKGVSGHSSLSRSKTFMGIAAAMAEQWGVIDILTT